MDLELTAEQKQKVFSVLIVVSCRVGSDCILHHRLQRLLGEGALQIVCLSVLGSALRAPTCSHSLGYNGSMMR